MLRQKFKKEFKFEAVTLVAERDVAVAQAARDLDLAESVLRRWIREASTAPPAVAEGLRQANSLSVSRLRKPLRFMKPIQRKTNLSSMRSLPLLLGKSA